MSHDLRHVMKVADRPGVVMVEGRGSWLWDRDGSPLMAAVGCAVVETVRDRAFLNAVAANGRYLMDGLRALSGELGHGEVRGRGLLGALELKGRDAAKVARAAFDRGLLINAPRSDTLRFMPSLTVSRYEIDRMLDLLGTTLADA